MRTDQNTAPRVPVQSSAYRSITEGNRFSPEYVLRYNPTYQSQAVMFFIFVPKEISFPLDSRIVLKITTNSVLQKGGL
jgi:hypothetical protein